MDGGHVSNDEFFHKLEQLFNRQKTREHGSIYLVQKRLTYGQDLPSPSPENPMPDLHPSKPLPVIVRATNGKSKENRAKKLKLSTIVDPSDLDGFYVKYAELCKAGMSSLKPRDKSKKKAKAKKKKGGTANNAGNTS